MSVNNPTCPTGCSSFLPVVSFDHCDPEVHFGEINRLYLMAYNGSDLANWELLAVWTARISNTDVADVDKIRELTVSADFPAAESEDVAISDNRKIATPKTFTINFDIDDTTEENYDFLRTLECGSIMKAWFASPDLIFGGNDGIPIYIKANYVIERGTKSVHKIMGVISWENAFSPERAVNPMA